MCGKAHQSVPAMIDESRSDYVMTRRNGVGRET